MQRHVRKDRKPCSRLQEVWASVTVNDPAYQSKRKMLTRRERQLFAVFSGTYHTRGDEAVAKPGIHWQRRREEKQTAGWKLSLIRLHFVSYNTQHFYHLRAVVPCKTFKKFQRPSKRRISIHM